LSKAIAEYSEEFAGIRTIKEAKSKSSALIFCFICQYFERLCSKKVSPMYFDTICDIFAKEGNAKPQTVFPEFDKAYHLSDKARKKIKKLCKLGRDKNKKEFYDILNRKSKVENLYSSFKL